MKYFGSLTKQGTLRDRIHTLFSGPGRLVYTGTHFYSLRETVLDEGPYDQCEIERCRDTLIDMAVEDPEKTRHSFDFRPRFRVTYIQDPELPPLDQDTNNYEIIDSKLFVVLEEGHARAGEADDIKRYLRSEIKKGRLKGRGGRAIGHSI